MHANGLPALLSHMQLGRNFPHHHHHHHQMSPFPIGPNGAPWLGQYIVQPQMQHQVNDHHALHHSTFRGELVEPTTRWQMEMISSGMDPNSLQYIPQLAPHLSSLHVSNPPNPYGHLQAAGPAGGHGAHHAHHHHHHGGYPTIYTAGGQAAAAAAAAANVMPATLSLATESDATSTAASPDDSFSYGTF